MGSRNDIRVINPYKEEDSVLSSSLFGLIYSCLLGARARTFASKSKSIQTKKKSVHGYNDSGSKLRDKEQQRLSSK